MKNGIKILACLTTSVLIVVYVQYANRPYCSLTPNLSQLADLKMIAGAINQSYIERRDNSLKDISSRILITDSNIYQLIAPYEITNHTSLAKACLTKTNHVSDLWGNDLHFEAYRKHGSIILVIWSNGPNGKNEQRIGDDVVYEADLILTP